jgi:hypothetical protein
VWNREERQETSKHHLCGEEKSALHWEVHWELPDVISDQYGEGFWDRVMRAWSLSSKLHPILGMVEELGRLRGEDVACDLSEVVLAFPSGVTVVWWGGEGGDKVFVSPYSNWVQGYAGFGFPKAPYLPIGDMGPWRVWRVLGKGERWGFGPHNYPLWVGLASGYIPNPFFVPKGVEMLREASPRLWQEYRGLLDASWLYLGTCEAVMGDHIAPMYPWVAFPLEVYQRYCFREGPLFYAPYYGGYFGVTTEGVEGVFWHGILMKDLWERLDDPWERIWSAELVTGGAVPFGVGFTPSVTSAVSVAREAIPAYWDAFQAFCEETISAWEGLYGEVGSELGSRLLTSQELDRVLGRGWRGPCEERDRSFWEVVFSYGATQPGISALTLPVTYPPEIEEAWRELQDLEHTFFPGESPTELLSLPVYRYGLFELLYRLLLFRRWPAPALNGWVEEVKRWGVDVVSGERIGDAVRFDEPQGSFYEAVRASPVEGFPGFEYPGSVYARLGKWGEVKDMRCSEVDRWVLPQLEARLRPGCRLYFVPPEAQEAEISRLSAMTGVDPRWYRVMAQVYQSLREIEEAILAWKP